MTPGGFLVSDTFGRPVSVQRTPTNRNDSDVSTLDTVKMLRHYAHVYAADPLVRGAVKDALSGLGPWSSQRDLANAIFYWVRARIRFTEDEKLLAQELGVQPEELDKEFIIVPPTLLSMPVPLGDCDDFSLLTAAMCVAAGLKPFFVTVAADGTTPRKFSHIYIIVKLQDEGTSMCLDTGNRMIGIPPGWEAPTVLRKAIWAV